MAFDLGTAIGYLDLDTSKFKKGFKSALGDLETFNSKTSTTSQKTYAMGSALSSVGSTLTKNVTLPLVGVGTAAVGVTSKFDSAMSQVAAVSGATGDSLDALREKAKEMGATTKFSASEAADAMNYMAMAGWKTEDMLDGIAGIMDLAAASGEDLATTSDIVTDALTAFGLTAADSGHFADVLAAASSNANTNVSMMGETFKYCAPIAGSLGYSVEDTAEAIGLMANAGIKSTQAGTALRTIMTSLTGEIQICGDSLGEVTIATSNADGSMRDFSDILADCRVAFNGLSESEQAAAAEALVGKNAMSGFLAIMNAAPADIEKLSSAIDTCDGTSKRMADTMQDNLGGQLTILKSTLEGLAISIGELLMPLIRKLVSWLQDLLTKINNLSEGQKKTIVILAGVVAAIGPVLSIVGKLLMTIGSLPGKLAAAKSALSVLGGVLGGISAPVLAVVAAVAALVAAFVTLWKNNEEFRNKITAIWNGIKDMFSNFFGQITDKINSLGFNFENFGEVLKALWTRLCDFLGPYFIAVFQYISDTLQTILDVILGVVDFFIAVFKGDWEGAWEAIKGIFMAVWNGIVSWFKNIGTMLTGMLDVICGWFGTTWESTWNGIKDFFVNVWTSIKDFFVGIWDGIVGAVQTAWNWIVNLLSGIGTWIYDNVIAPVAQFFTDLWNGIVNAYHTVIDPWVEIFRRLSEIVYNDIILPIQQFFIDLWNGITSGLQSAWDWIVNLASTVANWVYTNVIQPVLNFYKGLWDAISGAASACWNMIVSVWESVSSWFNSTVIEPVKGFFTGLWNGLKNGAQGAWNGIKSVFSTVANFFGNIFKGAWEKVKAVFSTGGKIFDGIKDGIVTAFKAVVNTIIKGINTVVALPFNGLNGILETLSSLEIVGVKPFSWLTWRAPVPQIPMLAEGAVIDANNPFLAILGDQKSGVNIEAPLSTIQEAVALVLASFAKPLVELQNLTVVILGDILQAILSFSELKDRMQAFQEATRQASLSNQDFDGFTKSGQWFDYEQLAGYLATALRDAPIQPKVSVEMQDGDVYLDKERVGRTVAPVVSRVIIQKS